MTARYEIAPVSVTHTTSTTVNLRQMSSWKIRPQTSRKSVRVGGNINSQGSLLGRAKYTCEFETADLATLLPLITPRSGLKVDSAVFRLLQRDEAGAFKTGGNHVTWTAANGGALYTSSISVDAESPDGAIASSSFIPYGDTGADPWTIAASVDLDSAPTGTFTSVYFLGGVYVDGTELPGVQSQEIDFGIAFEDVIQTIGPYSETAFVRTAEPVFKVTSTSMASLAGKAVAGFAIGSDVSFYFQKGIIGGGRVAVATAEHIKVSCTAGTIEITDTGGEAPNDAQSQWTIYPSGGTVAINSATAIPTAA